MEEKIKQHNREILKKEGLKGIKKLVCSNPECPSRKDSE